MSALRHALRSLGKTPGFTAVALLTLALCLGANLAIFAVVDAVLIRPLPFPEADRLVIAYNSYPKAGSTRAGSSLSNYYDRRIAIKAFASSSIRHGGSAIVNESGSALRVSRDRISPEFFATLGVSLAKGRTFTEDEMIQGNGNVAIITDAFWRSQFNATPEILGQTFLVNNNRMTVVGVLPPGFQFLSAANTPRFYVPAASKQTDRAPDQRHSNNSYQFIARLAPDTTIERAQAELNAFNTQQLADDPLASEITNAGYCSWVEPLHTSLVRTVRPLLILLQAAVGCLLLIGGVNLANLFLIRASGRAKELAIRQSLGASRWHVARHILIETTGLALAGGLLGVWCGAFALDLLARFGSEHLPLGDTIALNARGIVAALAGAFGVGLGLALPVIWFTMRSRPVSVLSSESRTGTTGPAAQRLRHSFIVAQIGLSFTLLTGAALLGLSLHRVLATPPGFKPDQVLTCDVTLVGTSYNSANKRFAYIERLLAELRAQPGVLAAGITSVLPFGDHQSDNVITVEGAVRAPGESVRTNYKSIAVGDYWTALGIPLIEGRFLEAADNQRPAKVAVVDQDFARRNWPGQSALGHRYSHGVTFSAADAVTIVGVVGTTKQTSLSATDTLGAVIENYHVEPSYRFYVVVRTALDPQTFGPTLRHTLQSLDPQIPLNDLKPMTDRIEDSLFSNRAPAVLASVFAVVALLLTAVGTYGVLAYAVSQRRREIGVRMALGAMPRQVLTQFLRLGRHLLVGGLTLGLAGAWAGGRFMESQLYEVAPMHPGILAGTALLLTAVVSFAILLPARRATKVDPIEALRAE